MWQGNHQNQNRAGTVNRWKPLPSACGYTAWRAQLYLPPSPHGRDTRTLFPSSLARVMPLWQKGNVGEFQFPIIFYIVFVYYRVLVKLAIYLKKALPHSFM